MSSINSASCREDIKQKLTDEKMFVYITKQSRPSDGRVSHYYLDTSAIEDNLDHATMKSGQWRKKDRYF